MSGFRSKGSLVTLQMCISLIIINANPSSSKICSTTKDPRKHLTDLICLSEIPPWCDPAGGLNFQDTPFLKQVGEDLEILNGLSQFSFRSDELGAIIRSFGHHCATSGCINAGVCIYCMCNLNVHCSYVKTQ